MRAPFRLKNFYSSRISLLFYWLVMIFIFFVLTTDHHFQWEETYSYQIILWKSNIVFYLFIDSQKWAAKLECRSILDYSSEYQPILVLVLDPQSALLSSIATLLLLIWLLSRIVEWRNLFTINDIRESLKKNRGLSWFFALSNPIQRILFLSLLFILWFLWYWFFSTHFYLVVSQKVLQWLATKAACGNEQEQAERKASKSTKETAEKKPSTKTEASSAGKASPSSAKGKKLAKANEKSSTSSKKKKASAKVKTLNTDQESPNLDKLKHYKVGKGYQEDNSSGRPVREEDLRGDNKQVISQVEQAINRQVINQVEQAKNLSQKREETGKNYVDYFPEFENAKGMEKGKVTKIGDGESSNTKNVEPINIRFMEGKDASELGKNLGKININSYIFKNKK